MANRVDGSITISTKIDQSGATKGISKLKNALKGFAATVASAFKTEPVEDFSQEVNRTSVSTADSIGGLKKTLKSFAAVMGLSFSAAAVKNFADETVDAASKVQNALQGVKSIVEGQGRSYAAATEFLQAYVSDGLVPMNEAATAYKNLASRGYNDSQIQSVMNALKDSAAFGRQSSLTLGAAVSSATEGLKNENSILVDNAGVTKNVSKMWEEHAKSLGTTVTKLTQQQKIQAEVNGILKETRFQLGDAAKVAGMYSGQVSQLSFNYNNLKVAIGNGVQIVYQQAMPVINKIILRLTDLANIATQVVSSLFGSSKQSKSNNQIATSATAAAKGEAELADATADAAKEAKRAVAGFDELNTLTSDTADTTNATADNGLSIASVGDTAGGEISVGENITISPKAKKIAGQIKAFISNLRDMLDRFSPLLKGISTGFIAAFGFKWLSSALAKIKSIDLISGAIGAIKMAIGETGKAFAETKNPIKAATKGFSSLGKSFKTYMRNLSGAQKAAVSVVALTAAFVTAKSAAKDYFLGTKDLGTALLNIIPVCAAVGVAMYSMLGWGALALAAVTAVAGALVGFNEAQNELQRDFIREDFFDGVGISLDTFTNYLIAGQEESTKYRQKIEELSGSVESNNEQIANAQIELEKYQTILTNTGTLTSDQASAMEGNFKTLVGTIRDNFGYNVDIVFAAFSDASKKAAENLNADVGTMTSILTGFQKTFGEKTSELEAKMQPYWDKIKAGEILTPEDEQKFNDLLDYANDLATGVSETQVKLDSQLREISQIDFESTDAAVEKIEELKETGATLLDELDNSKIQSDTAIENLKSQARAMFEHGDLSQSAYNQAMSMFNDYSKGITAGYEADKKEIEKSISSALGAVEVALDDQIEKTAANTAPTWWQSFWESFYGDYDSLAYANGSGIENKIKSTVEEEIGTPIRTALTNTSKELGITADKELGRQLLDGLANGIEKNTDSATDATEKSSQEVIGTAKKTYDVHSPSKVFEDIGKNLMQGLANGVNKNDMVISSFTNLFRKIQSKTQTFCDNFRGSINSLMSNMTGSLNGIYVGADNKICYSAMPRVKVPALATGAVIPPNQKFLAMLGDQTNGRNLEAPESLIRQIVREESAGAYDNMPREVVLELNGRELARASLPYLDKERVRVSAFAK